MCIFKAFSRFRPTNYKSTSASHAKLNVQQLGGCETCQHCVQIRCNDQLKHFPDQVLSYPATNNILSMFLNYVVPNVYAFLYSMQHKISYFEKVIFSFLSIPSRFGLSLYIILTLTVLSTEEIHNDGA